ncbi:MAG: tetratricopeptide repeat protein [Deltaproteobacteria bacterium]|nr:tetratricopeptide repeat protein [Deltaproteobacteria bacterium]
MNAKQTAPAKPGIATLKTRIPMVGRLKEMEILEDVLKKAIEQESPMTVTILGNRGIGKSRLLVEFLQKTRQMRPGTQIYRAVCQESTGTYGVFARLLRARFGLLEGMDAAEARAKFREQMTSLLGDQRVTEFVHFLGSFIGLRYPDNPFIRTMEANPEQVAEIRKTVLRRFFEVDAKGKPTIYTFEDVEEAGQEETLDIIDHLSRKSSGSPLLFVCTATHEIHVRRPNWMEGLGDRHVLVELGPLSRLNSERYLTTLLSAVEDLSDALVQRACNMAGGNPYFIEQIVKMLLENGTVAQGPDGKWKVNLDRLSAVRLPMSVEEAIQARIGALTPAERDTMEKACTFGSVFWLGGLVSLGRADAEPPEIWGGSADLAPHIRDVIGGLVQRDYIMEVPDATFEGDQEYIFKHNLERDMIRRMTSPTKLNRYHGLIGEWLAYRIHGREDELEMLAEHHARGGSKPKAAAGYLQAANHARERYANAKAAEYYRRALEHLDPADLVTRFEALHNLGDVLQNLGRMDDALQCFEEMRRIAWRLDMRRKGGVAHNRIGRVLRELGKLDEALRHLGTGHVLFSMAEDRRGVASSLDDIGKVHWRRGEYKVALQQMQKAIEIRRQIGDLRSIALSLNNLGLVHQDSAQFEEALRCFTESLDIRRKIKDVPGLIISLNNLGTVYQDSGEHDKAIQLWQEALTEARRIDDRLRQAYLLTNIGVSEYQIRRYADAIKTLGEAQEIAIQLGDHLLQGETARAMGKTRMLMGDYAGAREALKVALGHFEAMRSKVLVSIALRTLAEVTFAGGWGEEEERNADLLFKRSLAICEEIGDNLERAKTLRSYAEMLAKQGKTRPAEEAKAEAEKILSTLQEPNLGPARESARIEDSDNESDIPIVVDGIEE